VNALLPILVAIFAVGFDIGCLTDLVRSDEVRGLPPLGWAVVICCFTPLGGIAYLAAGRSGGSGRPGGGGLA
jgi:hypothetical protein